jgi:hypothetical protein
MIFQHKGGKIAKHSTSFLKIGIRILMMTVLIVLGSGYSIMAKEYPTFFRGARPLGMGGAFIAVADDENAIFYNPAGIPKTQTFQIGLINPLVEVSENSIDLYSDIQDTDMDDTAAVSNLLKDNIGKHQHARVSLFPNVGFKIASVGVQLGVLAQGTFDADIHNPVWPEAHFDYVRDIGLFAGVGMKLPFAGLNAGIAIKSLTRDSLSEVYTAIDIASENFEDKIEDDLNSGSGLSADVGVMYSLPFLSTFNPQAALVIQNIPEMDMGDAKDIDTQINVGFAVEKSFSLFTVIGALDYMDISNNIDEDDDMAKRLHLGGEIKFGNILSVRGGLNQGYYTAGATLDLFIFRFDAATYAEEVGAYTGQREDRRYIGQITIGW